MLTWAFLASSAWFQPNKARAARICSVLSIQPASGSDFRTGRTVGGGLETAFAPRWSAKPAGICDRRNCQVYSFRKRLSFRLFQQNRGESGLYLEDYFNSEVFNRAPGTAGLVTPTSLSALTSGNGTERQFWNIRSFVLVKPGIAESDQRRKTTLPRCPRNKPMCCQQTTSKGIRLYIG